MDLMANIIHDNMLLFVVFMLLLAAFDLVLKLIAMWRSVKRDQLGWFIALGIINSIGIFPIIYLLIYKDRPED